MNKEDMIKRIRAATPEWDAITGGKKDEPAINQPTGKLNNQGGVGNWETREAQTKTDTKYPS